MSIEQIELSLSEIESGAGTQFYRALLDDIDQRRQDDLDLLISGKKTVDVNNQPVTVVLTNEETWYLRGRLSTYDFVLNFTTYCKQDTKARLEELR